MDSGEREMNPVAISFVNPRKEHWPGLGSNQRPSVLKSEAACMWLSVNALPRNKTWSLSFVTRKLIMFLTKWTNFAVLKRKEDKKHCGKRGKFLFSTFLPFPTLVLKAVSSIQGHYDSGYCLVKVSLVVFFFEGD